MSAFEEQELAAVEVTSAMIDAGVDELRHRIGDLALPITDEDLVRFLFRQMEMQRRFSSCC